MNARNGSRFNVGQGRVGDVKVAVSFRVGNRAGDAFYIAWLNQVGSPGTELEFAL